jgi:predicted esterase
MMVPAAPEPHDVKVSMSTAAVLRTRALLLLVSVGVSTAPPALAVPAPGDPALPAEALVLSIANRARRAAVPTDPVQAEVVAGTWAAPQPGTAVRLPDGSERRWQAAPLKDGRLEVRGAAGGYAYVPVTAAAERVMVLEASGYGMVSVNGEPRVGDAYGLGFGRIPVRLRAGVNDLLFLLGRGGLTVRLTPPKADAVLNLADVTAPDLLAGRPVDAEYAAVVLNTTAETADALAIEATIPGGDPVRTPVPALPPLGVRKVGFRVRGPAPADNEARPIALRLLRRDGPDWRELDAGQVKGTVRSPERLHKRTFRSRIDGSVQYYALLPATGGGPDKPGLVLTLHGAGVEAAGQAASYTAKPGLHLVAPTNRRPFGFDWEDWGRLDALEVLDLARHELNTDPRRTYLTGHSMGGHGAWHLGVTYPDRFAAVGPSAGWVSFRSYAGGPRAANPSPEQEMLLRATNPSDTLALARNLTPTGVYVLHGSADDNVPVGEARTMRKALAEFHPDFAYHEEPGVGHWWGKPGVSGAACVDWPPLFDFFARHALPEPAAVREVEFRTADPGVSAWCHWAGVEAQERPLLVSTVRLRHDPAKRRFACTTENVARLALDFAHLPPGQPLRVELDGQTLADVAWPAEGSWLYLARSGGRWGVIPPPGPGVKGPQRGGPFKAAFDNRVVFVYGTHGTPAENAWALAKARYDAEQFWYRGNGSIDVVPDTTFDPAAEPDRNVVLYGHADGNAAWAPLLGDGPVQVRRGAVRVGDREEGGDGWACLFVRPRPGSARALVAAVAGTGLPGLRLTDRLPYLSSGVGYPDWLVLGAAGVRGAGYFGGDWAVAAGESAWAK